MKGMKHLLFAATCAVLAACSQTDGIDRLPVPIGFTPTVDAQTRGGDLTAGTLLSFGVFASLTQGDFTTSSYTANFMHNQEVSKDGGTSWKCNPVKYWPNNATDKLSFFAYAPYNDRQLTVPGPTATGYPSFTYQVPTTEATQTDLLASVPVTNQTYATSSGNVSFSMKHALTKVKFIIKNGDSDGTAKTINSFSLKAQSGGTLTYTSSGFTWTKSGTIQSFTATASNLSVPTSQDATCGLATFYLVPDNTGIAFSMKYTMLGAIGGSEPAPAHTVTITDQAIDTSPAWAAGKTITYTITIKKTGLEVEATGDTWEEGKKEEMQVYAAGELKPGDYYYSDGTTSDGGLRVLNLETGEYIMENTLPDAIATKTVAGIVYYVGLHPTDNCSYTAKGGSPMTKVSGYVVALDNVGAYFSGGGWVKYQNSSALYLVGASMDKNDYKGYENTHLIKSTAQNRGIWSNNPFHLPYMVLEGNLASVPDACSGWYMPSAGQVQDLYKYRAFIQQIMAELGKTMTGGSTGTCWTSTEVNANNAYKFDGFNGNSGHLNSYSKGGRDATRPVLTF